MADKKYKYEFHIHTWFSKDSLLNKWVLLFRCKMTGMDGIAITDHNSLRSQKYGSFFKRRGIDIIQGEEIMTTEGEIIGLFLKKEISPMMSPEMTVSAIKKQGGMVYIPHPYDAKRRKTILSDEARERILVDIDFIEKYNARTEKEEDIRKQKAIAEEVCNRNSETVGLIGSDAHIWWELGKNYCVVDERISKDNIKRCIRAGSFRKTEGKSISHKFTKIVKVIRLIQNLETMHYQTLSMQDVKEKCYEFAEFVAKEFQPELIIFIAKGGFLIGNVFADFFQVPLAEVSTERRGGNLKKYLVPLFRVLPKKTRFWMIDLEMNLGIHRVSHERKVQTSKQLENYAKRSEKYTKILIVDDSIDTGNTVCSVKQVVQKMFPDAEVKTAGISMIRFSEKLLKTDFFLYKDTIINTGTSKDSKEYENFITEYSRWEKNHG